VNISAKQSELFQFDTAKVGTHVVVHDIPDERRIFNDRTKFVMHVWHSAVDVNAVFNAALTLGCVPDKEDKQVRISVPVNSSPAGDTVSPQNNKFVNQADVPDGHTAMASALIIPDRVIKTTT